MLGWFRRKKKKKVAGGTQAGQSPPAEGAKTVAAAAEAAKGDTATALADQEAPAATPTADDGAVVQERQGHDAPVASDASQGGEEETGARRRGLFQRLSERLTKTRSSLVSRMDSVFLGRRKIDADLYEELEEILITADLGVSTTQNLLDDAKKQVARQQLSDPQALKAVLKEGILHYLLRRDKPAELVMPENGPFVIMVLGVNGVGKTTTIGKMANKFKKSGQKVLLVAADTFRAAAIEQLQTWGERIGVEVVAQQQGADPSSVIYDALDFAGPRDFDVIIVDTAGRLHTKVNLMEELKKIGRVIDKKMPGAPHEVMLIIDATTGQNGISQAKQFNQAVQLTGLTLTKLDGTAKGGIVVNICHEFDIPIRFIGIGEKMEDLRDFEPREFVDALFGDGEGCS